MSGARIRCSECSHVAKHSEPIQAEIEHLRHFKREHPNHRLVKSGEIDDRLEEATGSEAD